MSKGSSKKGIKIFLFIILAAIAVAALFFFSKAKEDTEADKRFTMAANAERIEFLNAQGWIVDPDPVSKEEITVPSVPISRRPAPSSFPTMIPAALPIPLHIQQIRSRTTAATEFAENGK